VLYHQEDKLFQVNAGKIYTAKRVYFQSQHIVPVWLETDGMRNCQPRGVTLEQFFSKLV
jgi:hypothetical protein